MSFCKASKITPRPKNEWRSGKNCRNRRKRGFYCSARCVVQLKPKTKEKAPQRTRKKRIQHKPTYERRKEGSDWNEHGGSQQGKSSIKHPKNKQRGSKNTAKNNGILTGTKLGTLPRIVWEQSKQDIRNNKNIKIAKTQQEENQSKKRTRRFIQGMCEEVCCEERNKIMETKACKKNEKEKGN